MSTLKTNTLSNVAGTSSTAIENAIHGSAKAWVNFNGTGTVAIRASYNVSSITDHAAGQYTVNFTTALSDENYAAVLSCETQPTGDYGSTLNVDGDYAPTTSGVRIICQSESSSLLQLDRDCTYGYVSVFR